MEETELGKSLPLPHQRPLRGLALLGFNGDQLVQGGCPLCSVVPELDRNGSSICSSSVVLLGGMRHGG